MFNSMHLSTYVYYLYPCVNIENHEANHSFYYYYSNNLVSFPYYSTKQIIQFLENITYK